MICLRVLQDVRQEGCVSKSSKCVKTSCWATWVGVATPPCDSELVFGGNRRPRTLALTSLSEPSLTKGVEHTPPKQLTSRRQPGYWLQWLQVQKTCMQALRSARCVEASTRTAVRNPPTAAGTNACRSIFGLRKTRLVAQGLDAMSSPRSPKVRPHLASILWLGVSSAKRRQLRPGLSQACGTPPEPQSEDCPWRLYRWTPSC